MIATQDYGWSQLAVRAGIGWPEGTAWAMRQAAEAGFDAWEPLLRGPEDAVRIGALAVVHGLAMPSVFVAGILHDEAAAKATMAGMNATIRAAQAYGCTQVMVYPLAAVSGQKTVGELVEQARNLQRLAEGLDGAALLYHNEEPEMRDGAFEFEHILANTDPALLRLCLDPDAAWRGGEPSAAALLALVGRHAERIDALHLRQSQGGVWAETVGPGDLPLPALAEVLKSRGRQPLLVVEHAYEDATPATLDPVEAHRRSLDYVREIFALRGPSDAL